MEMVGFDQHGCSESRYRLIREQPRDQRKLLVHQAEAVEDHRFHRIARGHDPRVWLVSGGSVNDPAHAECIEHRRNKAQMVYELPPGGMGHGVLLARGAFYGPMKIHQLAQDTAECRAHGIQ
jgi:hypothetical protein